MSSVKTAYFKRRINGTKSPQLNLALARTVNKLLSRNDTTECVYNRSKISGVVPRELNGLILDHFSAQNTPVGRSEVLHYWLVSRGTEL